MKQLITVFFFFYSFNAIAQLVSDDSPYLVRHLDGHRIIYSSEYSGLIDQIESKYIFLNDIYSKEFMWSFDEDSVLVMASSKNQIPNGFATQYPRLLTMFYNGGPEFIDEFAVTSWGDVLLNHETVHLYQLNVRHGYSSFLKKVLGRPLPGVQFPFAYMLTPHFFTPTFMMEGNATFNEGRFGNGGRLYSGQYRALFLQLIKNEKINAHRLMNDRLDWPFGTEKYIVGGYFFQQLAEDFGAVRANSFFNQHAYRYAFPFLIESSLRDSFDVGYMGTIDSLNYNYQSLARKQLELPGPSFAKSYEHAGFTRIDDDIYFMKNSFYGLQQICKIQKGTDLINRDLDCAPVRMPFGRVFKVQGQIASAAYQQTHPTEIRAGLFTDGYRRMPGFDDKFVFHADAKKTIYADAKTSFMGTRVFSNDKFLAEMQSSPVIDLEGNIYYFKQQGAYRRLYKNDKPILQIDGYYGRVCDIDSNGTVYFTGAVEEGSNLFQWDGTEVKSVLASDIVIDAKLIDRTSAKKEFIVAEITDQGFEYRTAFKADRNRAPVKYTYKFKNGEKENEQAQAYLNLSKASGKSQADFKYNPLSEMEFNGLDPAVGANSDGRFLWLLGSRFSDPLQRYFLNLLVGDVGWNSYVAQASFLSTKNRLNWLISALYEQDAIIESYGPDLEEKRVLGRFSETETTAAILYPFIKTPLWNSQGYLGYTYESTSEVDATILSQVTPDYVNAIDLKYDISYSFRNLLDFAATEMVELELNYRNETEGSDRENSTDVYRGSVGLQKDILWQTFLSASYDAALAKGNRDTLTLKENPVAPLDPTEFSQISEKYVFGGFYELRKVNVELRQGIMLGLYHRSIPLGLRRLAPYIGYSEFYGTDVKGTAADTLFHEAYAGMSVELLLLHKFPLVVELVGATNSLDPDTNLLVKINQMANF